MKLENHQTESNKQLKIRRKRNRHPTNRALIARIENILLMLGAEVNDGHFSLTYKKRMRMV